jgi:hypothetical protein
MTKILILNVGNGMNKGNLALLYSTLEARRRIGDEKSMVKEKAMLNGKLVKDVLEEIKSRGGMK